MQKHNDRPAIFLDRDGVLNRRPVRTRYVRNWGEWEWLPGALDALRRLTEAGWCIVVATNQAGIGRGEMSEDDLTAIHARMRTDAAAHGGMIEAIYHCPHHPDAGCDCRKPKPGMLLKAARELSLDLSRTPFAGDDDRDAQAAVAAGCPFERVSEARPLATIVDKLLAARRG